MIKRKVVQGDGFLIRAKGLFPPGGSSDGRPSFELFCKTVLKTAEFAFGSDFEGCLAEDEGSPIRFVQTADVALFPVPLAFYALLTGPDTVEIVDLIEDEAPPEAFEDDDW